MTLVHDPARVPSGQQVRRLTSQIQGAREGRGLGAVVQELWYAAITIGLCVAFVAGVATTIRDAVPEPASPTLASGDLPAALVVIALAGAVLSLAGRLGPVGVGGGGAAWWLPMPVGRRGLLRPAVLAWPAASGLAGLVVAPLVMTAFGATASVAGILAWAGVGGSLCAALAAAAVFAQGVPRERPNGRRPLRPLEPVVVVGDAVLFGAMIAVAGLALAGEGGALAGQDAGSGGAPLTLGDRWWLAVPLAVAAVALTAAAERRSGRLDGARLRAKGSIGERARVAVLSLDLRELSRALTVDSGPARRRSLRLRPGGPRRAVALADLVLLVRSPRLLLQIVVVTLLAVAATRMSLLGQGLPLYGVMVLTGFWAANTAAAGGRQAEMAPVLDRLLPLSARQIRVVRGAVPLCGSAIWTAVVLGLQAASSGNPLWWALMAPWALVLAAAAVRSAYRPQPNWARTAVSTPMGGAPPTAGLFKGLDVALVGTLPTAVMLYVGVLTPTLVIGQYALGVALLTILVAASGRRRAPGS